MTFNLRFLKLVLFGLLTLAMAACAGDPRLHEDERHYLDRAETKSSELFTVSAAALSIQESTEVFGVPLNNVGIQPVWIEINNASDHPQWLFPIGVDDEYFPPYEVARRMSAFSDLTEQELYSRLEEQHIPHFIPAGSSARGFVYAHADEGMKAFNIELHSSDDVHNFHFVSAVPGLPSDYFDLQDGLPYAQHEIVDLDSDGLRRWLEEASCCTVDTGSTAGDPLNVVFVGSLEQVRSSMISNGWDVTAPVTGASLWRMATAFVFGSRYRYAPISGLYVFDREQDLAFQKSRAIIDERNHMRLWLAPVTANGTPVWLGQASRDVGIKLSGRLWPPTTHVIDPDTDDARFYILQEMIDSGAISQLGFVKGHTPTDHNNPHRNAENDPYFTDGLRAVFFMSEKAISRANINLLDWGIPAAMAVGND